jgi:SAM-dependent methyltransferase
MLGNLVNHHDAVRIVRKVGRGHAVGIFEKISVRGTARVVAHFSTVDPSMREWWAIPAVNRRWNNFASGDPSVSFPQHVARKWLAGRSDLRALSLGSGAGGNEIIWAGLGIFDHITGIEISPEPVDHATRRAKELGLDDTLSFRAADVRELAGLEEKFDVILGLQSLHHFDRLDDTMELIADLLTPKGLLVVDEFVGPTRFQWTSSQIRAANSMLAMLPDERRRLPDGRIKRKVTRPSLMSMRLDDPSEAVDASNLLPALRRRFTVLEEMPYGGTVLHLALSGIAQNFLDEDPDTLELLERCFAAEDAALPQLGHDFVYLVCEPSAGANPPGIRTAQPDGLSGWPT